MQKVGLNTFEFQFDFVQHEIVPVFVSEACRPVHGLAGDK